MQNAQVEVTDEYDKEFINLIMEVEKRSGTLKKHDQLRVNSWCKKLCQVTNNIEWKKNRNLHAICLLDMVLNERFEEPYNKFAPEGSVPIISKTIVKSRLSTKFLRNTMQMQNQQRNYFEEKENNFQQQKGEPYAMPMNSKPQAQPVLHKGKPKFSNENNMDMGGDDNDVHKLREKIKQLQLELKRKDESILRYKDEKLKSDKRIQELEKLLSGFAV